MTARPAEAAPVLSNLLGAALPDALLGMLDPEVPAAQWEKALAGPLAAFTCRPGKELRARLTEFAWTLAGGIGAVPSALPLGVEALHAGSLIIDDVQDGGSMRRGGPALHVACGVPLAINTGNWLYFWALDQLDSAAASPEAMMRVHRLAVSTLLACHHGQALDLSACAFEIDRRRIAAVVAAITRGKSAALMGLGPRLAAIVAGATVPSIDAVGALGEALGTGLQMMDDLGGLGPSRRIKGREDLREGRLTWPWAWLADTVDDLTFSRLQHRARAAAEVNDAAALDEVADAIRTEVDAVGRQRARAVFDNALTVANTVLGSPAELRTLVAYIHTLENSYG